MAKTDKFYTPLSVILFFDTDSSIRLGILQIYSMQVSPNKFEFNCKDFKLFKDEHDVRDEASKVFEFRRSFFRDFIVLNNIDTLVFDSLLLSKIRDYKRLNG